MCARVFVWVSARFCAALSMDNSTLNSRCAFEQFLLALTIDFSNSFILYSCNQTIECSGCGGGVQEKTKTKALLLIFRAKNGEGKQVFINMHVL